MAIQLRNPVASAMSLRKTDTLVLLGPVRPIGTWWTGRRRVRCPHLVQLAVVMGTGYVL